MGKIFNMENGQGTTSISKLPSNAQQNIITQPLQNTNNNNIVLTQNEVVAESTAQMANPMMQQIATQMPEKNQQQNHNNYNEMISQLQKANLAGVTTMPSRDIPMDPVTINNDQQIKPNFIPEPQNVDY